MLSKNKVSKVVAAWLHEQFWAVSSSGASLVDEAGGDSVRIDRVRQSGSLVFLDVCVSDSSDRHDSFELCLKLSRQVEADSPKSKSSPTPSELAEIDNTP